MLDLPQEIQRTIFEITLALYRVTDILAQGEALRTQLRQKATDILSLAVEYDLLDTKGREKQIALMMARTRAIKKYLELADKTQLIKSINAAVLSREYTLLENFFAREKERLAGIKLDVFSKEFERWRSRSIPNYVYTEKKEMIEKVDMSGAGPKQHSEEGIIKEKFDPVVHETGKEELVSFSLPSDSPNSPKLAQRADSYLIDFQSNDKQGDGNENKEGSTKKADKKEAKVSSVNSRSRSSQQTDPIAKLAKKVSERQKAIIKFIKEKQEARISDFHNDNTFAKISSKTIQRDLQDLVSKNILKKQGNKRWTIYTLKN